MSHPELTIDLSKIRDNARKVLSLCRAHGIEPAGVTKVCRAEPRVAQALVDEGFTMLADSRLDNLERIRRIPVPKLLLRIPMISEAARAVALADWSLLSEPATARALSDAAVKAGRTHGVIAMLELGDLREGCPDEAALFALARAVVSLPGLKLEGVGANFICYGGVVPSHENLARLVNARDGLEARLGVRIPWVSGGGSYTERLLASGNVPAEVNHLRTGALIHVGIGEGDRRVPGYHFDAYRLTAEVVEANVKPSMPWGEIGTDAFGQIHHWVDRGPVRRVILAVGRQDVEPDALTPEDPGAAVLGASSDHLLLDVTRCDREFRVGDRVSFAAGYASVLRACTSPYVCKRFAGGRRRSAENSNI